jgi:hypothetical protein
MVNPSTREAEVEDQEFQVSLLACRDPVPHPRGGSRLVASGPQRANFRSGPQDTILLLRRALLCLWLPDVEG